MLLSMTGFGESHLKRDGLTVSVEVRSVNNRYLKLLVRSTEGYGPLEPQIEAAVREKIRRGTIQVNLKVDRPKSPEDYRINTVILDGYRQQLLDWSARAGLQTEVPWEHLLLLPGVAEEDPARQGDVSADWPVIREALEAALAGLVAMRAEEGRAMAADMRSNGRLMMECLQAIAARAPQVVEAYRTRLQDRLAKTLADFEVTLDPSDVIREVSLFADRGDISEEIVRLRSHLEQFDAILDLPESSGRKLEFLTQEMLRETNTIGSKASDVEIARQVIEIKSAIERIREMIQNIE